MREIKFRGKRIDNNEWVEGYYGKLTDGESVKHYIMTNTLTFNPNKSIYFTDCEVDPETVRQYTGLKDKNDKEIYEGDYLGEWMEEQWVIYGIVKYCDKKGCNFSGMYYLVEDYEKGLASEFMHEGEGNPKKWHNLEIIGNIYKNPKLLSQED